MSFRAFTLLLLLNFTVLPMAWSVEIVGRFYREGDRLFVEARGGRQFQIEPETEAIREDLAELEDRDHIELTAAGESHGRKWLVTAIHRLGLKRLFGEWDSREWGHVKVRSFFKLVRTQPRSEIVDFTVTPEPGPGFGVLLISRGVTTTGHLTATNGQFVITSQQFPQRSLIFSRSNK